MPEVKSAHTRNRVQANWIQPAQAGNPMSVSSFGGPHFTTMFQGILPEFNETGLIPYYRDIYYHDSVAGAAVDISSTFPFSEMALTGLDNEDLGVYQETLSRLNIRTFMQEVSITHLVDGQYTGTLVYDPDRRVFQDVMSHDALNTSVTPQPFHALEPVIKVNSAHVLEQLLNAGSPYLDSVLASYPAGIVDRYRQGTVVLDPMTTLYIPRKGAMDRESVSYLKRILPMYMLEKVLYRGTLTEAHKRQRPTSHVTVGSENWTATDTEMQAILGEFQRTELDPLGAWIVTREGVQVNDIRMPDGQWRWTDLVDILVPYKLRALGISEAFLSGEASFATAETAITVFLDSMDAYREMLTYKIFTRKICPLVAVLHGFYKDPSKMEDMSTVSGIIANLNNHQNLRIPQVNWFKSLNGKDTESQWDMLDKLSEKGFTIPLKMWAAAASVDIGSLIQDLEEDQEIKAKIESVTGQKSESIGVHEDSGMASGARDGEVMASLRKELAMVSAREKGDFIRTASHPISSKTQSRRVPLLAREMDPGLYTTSKSGKVRHSVVREAVHTRKVNDTIVKAMRALQDPNHRATIRANIKARKIDL
jgi:hypothetical protein